MATRSTCAGCGLVFSSVSAFDRHRSGSYGVPIVQNGQVVGYTPEMRVCIVEEALRKKGMTQNAKGIWSMPSNGLRFWEKSKKVDDEAEDVSEIA